MNRRDLFKRAGKMGVGLGIGAIVGSGLKDSPEEVVGRLVQVADIGPLTAHHPITESTGVDGLSAESHYELHRYNGILPSTAERKRVSL